MKILLTAPPGLGKTTILETVVKNFKGAQYGIVAREILNASGERIGFTSVNRHGQSRQFMFRTDEPTEDSIAGLFDVDVSAIDEFVVPELQHGLNQPDCLVFIDEIGRAQARSRLFLNTLRLIFNSDCNILASIVYDDEPWSMEFKANRSACLLPVTEENRDHLPDILLSAFINAKLFKQLKNSQQIAVLTHLNQLVLAKKYIAAGKLFDNAVRYVVEERVRVYPAKMVESIGTDSGKNEYEVEGKTRNHSIIHDTITDQYSCDCDLSNGRAPFENQQQTCSHELAVRLTLAGI